MQTFATDQKKGFWQNTYVSKIGVPGTKDADHTGASLLDSISKFINWALGMLATVALVICLYAGVKMMTAGGNDWKYQEGFDMIKKAAIGLVIIGCSWLIVSFVMWIIGNVTANTAG